MKKKQVKRGKREGKGTKERKRERKTEFAPILTRIQEAMVGEMKGKGRGD